MSATTAVAPVRAGGVRSLWAGNPGAVVQRGLIAARSSSWMVVFSGFFEPVFFLADIYNGREQGGSYADNSVEVYQATTCVDNDWTSDSASTLDRLAEITAAAPTIGPYITLDDYAVLDVLCNNWPYPAAEFPEEYDAEGAAPILVIGTTNDPATPYIWAQSLATQLSSGVLVTVDGDGHTAYNQDNDCVNLVVDEYFLDDVVPDSDPEC